MSAAAAEVLEETEDLHDYSEQYVVCRTFGHAWRVAISQQSPGSENAWLWVLKCRSCRTERHDIVSRVSGSLLHRHYDYPDGYQRPHHENNRLEFRLELISRVRAG